MYQHKWTQGVLKRDSTALHRQPYQGLIGRVSFPQASVKELQVNSKPEIIASTAPSTCSFSAF